MLRLLMTLYLLAGSALLFVGLPSASAVTNGQFFTFAAAGDHGATDATSASLRALSTSGGDFYLALGDMSYDQMVPESAWCDFVRFHLGPTFPFQLLAGNHEDDFLDDPTPGDQGFIDNFAACLPDRLNSRGAYAKEYYFDFPASEPLARFILIAAGYTLNGETYDYSEGSPHYRWLSDTIDDARGREIPWVIVGMSNLCISLGVKGCPGGPALMGLLMSKRVDLVLQSDEHNYQRSKQLTCAELDVFRPDCVVDDGLDGLYEKGSGAVLVVAGTFGHSLVEVDILSPEADYFAKGMGHATVFGSAERGGGYGFVRYSVSASRIDAEFILTQQTTEGTPFSDRFSIGSGPTNADPPIISLPGGPLLIALPVVVALAALSYYLIRRRQTS